ncbi:SCO family protein [Solimonas terrae]|uniref:SCO family protein n=1 Tax=Solimonas terrae TaxID=1396819 RepID=A0A6M2BNW6_9GAMM|nr:SCO family protein [Solimonas terrae]NGY04296.1 SCO family protein [Solimonas terrae]
MPMIRHLFRLAVLVLGLALLSACQQKQVWHLHKVAHLLPDLDFTMQQAGGGDVSASDFRGKTVLLYFGYTHCPDICPTTLARLRAVKQAVGDRAGPLQVLFVTVDPARDTSSELAAYVQAFDPSFIGLRGTPKQTAALARRYRVSFTRQNDEPDGGYTMSHSSAIFIFDGQGKARLLANEDSPVADFVADLSQLHDRR